jgi:hypothetical protein
MRVHVLDIAHLAHHFALDAALEAQVEIGPAVEGDLGLG